MRSYAMRMRHVICGLPGSTIFFHTSAQTARLSKKIVIEYKNFIVISSTIFA